jgi:hypothetical protein
MAGLAVIGCGGPAELNLRRQIKQYSGDGVISTCSNMLAGGYEIDFPKFDPAQPYQATFRLSHVPQALDLFTARTPYLFLRHEPQIDIPSNEIKARTTASFEFVLTDSEGHVTRARLPVATSIWGSQGVYDLDKSRLLFNSHLNYTLQVSYVPGERPPTTKQFHFILDNCAYY